MATFNFDMLDPEMDIGVSPDVTRGPNPKRMRDDDDSLDIVSTKPGPATTTTTTTTRNNLHAHFPASCKLVSQGERYRWVLEVLRSHPFNKTKGAIQIKNGRNNVYIKCKTEEILDTLTTVGAFGVILVKPKIYGKGICVNLTVFDVPTTVNKDDVIKYNDKILHARRVMRNGKPTERLTITNMGEKVPTTIDAVEGMEPRRCGKYHSLTPFCSHCSKWGHSIRACSRGDPRCKFCSRNHHSKICAEKISKHIPVPRKCANCPEAHNANSPLCRFYPKDRKNKTQTGNTGPSLPPNNSAPPPNIGDKSSYPPIATQKTIPKDSGKTPWGSKTTWGKKPQSTQGEDSTTSSPLAIATPGVAPAPTHSRKPDLPTPAPIMQVSAGIMEPAPTQNTDTLKCIQHMLDSSNKQMIRMFESMMHQQHVMMRQQQELMQQQAQFLAQIASMFGPGFVAGPSPVAGNISVAGPISSFMASPSSVAGPISAAGPISVAGTGSMAGPISVAGPISMAGTSSVAGSIPMAGPISMADTSSMAGPIFVAGTSSVAGPISVAGTSSVAGSISMAGPSSVVGPSTVAGTISVAGPSSPPTSELQAMEQGHIITYFNVQ